MLPLITVPSVADAAVVVLFAPPEPGLLSRIDIPIVEFSEGPSAHSAETIDYWRFIQVDKVLLSKLPSPGFPKRIPVIYFAPPGALLRTTQQVFGRGCFGRCSGSHRNIWTSISPMCSIWNVVGCDSFILRTKNVMCLRVKSISALEWNMLIRQENNECAKLDGIYSDVLVHVICGNSILRQDIERHSFQWLTFFRGFFYTTYVRSSCKLTLMISDGK